MLRSLFLLVISAAAAAAQFHWTCNAKDGKFMRGFGNEKYYCWDGQIFSTAKGYTPPPAYVLDYWVEAHRKMEETRAEIARKSQELADKVHQAQSGTMRINDELNRKIATKPISRELTTPVPARPESAPIAPPVSRAKAADVQVGMDRAAVEAILGKPHGAMSIPDDDGLVEVLNYMLDDKGTAKVRLEKGKVVAVKMLD